ncbi:MAG: hypothetical protein KGL59_06080 [Acidobacteriota bacterium]|nr:hypothetical protein [Acidobacteriota bacterium]
MIAAEGTLIYDGAIGVKPTRNDGSAALDEMMQGKQVGIPATPCNCSVKSAN